MALADYSISGDEEYGEDEEVLVRGDIGRSLVRFREGGGESYVNTRINPGVLADAKSLPVMHVLPAAAVGEVLDRDGLLSVDGSVRNYRLRERIVQALADLQCAACYLAERHGESRRDFYFTTEAPDAFRSALAAAAREMVVEAREKSFADSAIDFLPYEFFAELGVPVPSGRTRQKVRFGFWGAEQSLARLRSALETRGYQYFSLERAFLELRMTKVVSIEHEEFRSVLREIVFLSRDLGCSYRGEETVEGGDAFLLTRPLPQKYQRPERPPPTSFLGRLFGRKIGV